MKKFFMAAVVALCSLAANAQVSLGGEFSYVNSKDEVADVESTNNTFSIAPELVFGINDNWAIGVNLAYSHTENASSVFGINADGRDVNTWGINPFVRYTFAEVGDLKFFIDGGIDYAQAHVQGYDEDVKSFGVLFRPGMAYEITDNITLDAHLGKLSYFNTSYDAGKYDITNDEFTLEGSTAISFGLFFKF